VHLGEVERCGKDLRGIAVHIAARIGALADGDEILVSATVRDIVSGSGLSFADRGEQLLRGVPDPRRVFCVAQRS
jgi:class 3 adenylate cyclase